LQLSANEWPWFDVGAESRYDVYHDRDVVCIVYEDVMQMHQPEMFLAEVIAEMHLWLRSLGLSDEVFPTPVSKQRKGEIHS
jgi:hypothetical protein